MSSTTLTDGSYIKFQIAVLEQAPRPDELSKETAEFWLKNQEKLKRVLKGALLQKPSLENKPILRLLTTGDRPIIKATTGKRYLAKAESTFPSGVDSDFKNWKLDQESHATPETPTDVYEMINDATFAQMFGSLSNDLDKLCLTQDQIEEFCLEHHSQLRKDGYGTFFLFKENEQFFVAHVLFNAFGLLVLVSRLERDRVRDGAHRHRLVVPQL